MVLKAKESQSKLIYVPCIVMPPIKMAAFTTNFPSIIDLCPGPNLLFWTSNLKAIRVQRLTKSWQRDISLTSNPFKPNEILIHIRPQ